MEHNQIEYGKLARRYGPIAGVVGAIMLVVAIVPGAEKPATQLTPAGPAGVSATVAPAGDAEAPPTDAAAPGLSQPAAAGARKAAAAKKAASTAAAAGLSQAVCGRNGRLDLNFPYVAPCVPAFTGDNKGATWRGVTGNKIKLAMYLGWDQDRAAQSIAKGTGSCAQNDCWLDFAQTYIRWFKKRYQTYGRDIELVPLYGSGKPNDDATARADATKAIQELGVFAVLGGPASTAFSDELAANGVLCFCTTSLPNSYYEAHAPYVWSTLHSSTQAYLHRAEFIGKRLKGRTAITGDFKGLPRQFGFVWYDTLAQDYKPGAEFFLKHLKEVYGIEIPESRVVRYAAADVAQAQQYAPGTAIKMKSENVTSVIFAGDPFFPVSLMSAASSQNYHPEWIITGSALTDTDVFGRLYDQTQMRNAFGISLLAVPIPNEKTWWFRAFNEERAADSTCGKYGSCGTKNQWPTVDASVVAAPVINFFTGLHLAGPVLNPTTFRDGMFRYPPTGGTPTVPRMSYGLKEVPGFKFGDYTAYDDTMEIWWDPDAKDANGDPGAYARVDGGKRFAYGQWPTTDPKAFKKGVGEVYFFQNPPDQ
jgi:hypothetical protein